ncbi:MAG TPA: amino acid ABC transporter permease, partial [Candidatus Acidoferrum sp.]|nr:amino acid ABC transporter permease [Candidatus Acidoferrum sp.]
LLGIIVGLCRMSHRPWIHYPAVMYVEFFRGVPLVMVIFWFWFLIPQITGQHPPEYTVALTAFVVFEAAYLGEIVRAGIQSVPRGQIEAATAEGLSFGQMMTYVILPQAIRNMIPSLVTQFIVLFKDTSLAAIIGVFELTRAAQEPIERTFRSFEIYLLAAAIYFCISYPLSLLAQRAESRLGHS